MPAEENSLVNSWYTDPNEPRYCICDDVSYGDMVGCDNEDVSTLDYWSGVIKYYSILWISPSMYTL